MTKFTFAIFILMFIYKPCCIVCQIFFFYPNVDKSCTTPNGDDGECMRISDCNPEDRFLYITEDKKTTNFLRLVFTIRMYFLKCLIQCPNYYF